MSLLCLLPALVVAFEWAIAPKPQQKPKGPNDMTLLDFVTVQRAVMPTVNVFFEGERRSFAGRIKKTHRGWEYFPKGCSNGGTPFPTLDLCKKSLQDEPAPDAD